MKCIFCGQEQQTGESFIEGIGHLSCYTMQCLLAGLDKLAWQKPPDNLVEDVLKSPEVLAAEKIIGEKNGH